MRIGELAEIAGVSTRTIRHYHHTGLLAEPTRRANGYRDYRLRDAVVLARIRRLAELGLSLDEIRDVLADDEGRELREVLLELDADLAREQQAIAAKRARLSRLLAIEGDLSADAVVSPEMADVLRALPGEGFAKFDREMMSLLPPEVLAELGPMVEGAADLYARLDALHDAAPDDPRVAALAADLLRALPASMLGGLGEESGERWLGELGVEILPAQAAVFHQVMAMARERNR
ncbi:MerR family transcriptional regulator [Herbidospora sp. NEAU-GS84]|uniref:MerR family transcriptional regulator n=1 Tax=Herbidospora solisilvae TaxID=2696284 RepID=A0A7C9J4Y2_9ACTN|nr:MerR family transcriptional regulator [Herbidospora solisilvae]NAS24842.1 MerR family transcriptional regulator [Herbidospora solisilvae]